MRRPEDRSWSRALFLIFAVVLVHVSATAEDNSEKAADLAKPAVAAADKIAATPASQVTEKWGIEIVGLRSTAARMLIDFRYRVVDPDKALIFLDRTQDAYLTDPTSGMTVEVPVGKVGPMRQTNRAGKPTAGRIYFMLFANPGRVIQSGSKVTIQIGDFKVEDLVLD